MPNDFVKAKLVLLGDSGVGKSCLIKRYCEDKFVTKYVATIGIDFGVKPVTLEGTGPVKVNFFDFAGGAEYFEGMIASPLDARADENLDNLTPNIKLVGGATLVSALLVGAFLAANAGI